MPRPPGPSRLTGNAGAGWATARAAAVAVLLAVAVAGLRARGALSHQGGSSLANAGGRAISGLFEAAEGAGLVACVIVLALILPGLRRP